MLLLAAPAAHFVHDKNRSKYAKEYEHSLCAFGNAKHMLDLTGFTNIWKEEQEKEVLKKIAHVVKVIKKRY